MIEADKLLEAKKRGERLVRIREMLGLSRLKFCEKYGFANTTVAQWETLSGVSPGINERHARRIVQAIEPTGLIVSEVWLLYGTGEPPYQLKPAIKPPINRFHFDCSKATLQTIVETTATQLGEQYTWFEVQDDCMAPEYASGDFIIAIAVEENAWQSIFDHIACLVTLKSDVKILRRYREYEPGRVLLENTNPHSSHAQKCFINPPIQAISQIAIHYHWG